jgi:trk system potassium uptake protein TrkA
MDIQQAILTRRSIRKYTGEPVSEEQIKAVIRAGTYAPSAHNGQPWRFVVVDEPEYIPLAEAVGVDVAMSPLLLCGSRIAHYVLHGGAVSVALLGKEDAQVSEFVVSQNARISKRAVSALEWPRGAVIGAVVRGDTVMAPSESPVVEPGDTVIVAALLDEISGIEKLFKAP